MAGHLELRKGTYSVRLDIPKDVRHVFGKRIFKQSLKTGEKQEAERLKSYWLFKWRSEISAARAIFNSDEWKENAARLAEALKEQREHGVLVAAGAREANPDAVNQIDPLVDKLFSLLPPLPAKMKDLHRLFAQKNFRDSITLLAGVSGQTSVEFVKFIGDAAMGYATAVISNAYQLPEAETKEASEIVRDHRKFVGRTPFTKERLESYASYELKEKGLSSKTISQRIAKLEEIRDFLVIHERELGFDAVGKFIDGLDRAKSTKDQFMQAGSCFWRWAMRRDDGFKKRFSGIANPFVGQEVVGNKERETVREAFTVDEIKLLHSTAVAEKRQDLADLIALGAYTGGRIEELLRIRKEDTSFENGRPAWFRVTKAKTTSGLRDIPLHTKIQLLVSARIDGSNDGYLFPSGSENKFDIRSDPISKQFGRLKTRLGFGRSKTFHSIRKTTATELERKKVQPLLIMRILGHKTQKLTFDTYSEGAGVREKMEAIELLDFGLDI